MLFKRDTKNSSQEVQLFVTYIQLVKSKYTKYADNVSKYYKHENYAPPKPVILCNPCMDGGSIDSVHHPSTLGSSMYHEAGSQLPWKADWKSSCVPCRYGDKQSDQNVQ